VALRKNLGRLGSVLVTERSQDREQPVRHRHLDERFNARVAFAGAEKGPRTCHEQPVRGPAERADGAFVRRFGVVESFLHSEQTDQFGVGPLVFRCYRQQLCPGLDRRAAIARSLARACDRLERLGVVRLTGDDRVRQPGLRDLVALIDQRTIKTVGRASVEEGFDRGIVCAFGDVDLAKLAQQPMWTRPIRCYRLDGLMRIGRFPLRQQRLNFTLQRFASRRIPVDDLIENSDRLRVLVLPGMQASLCDQRIRIAGEVIEASVQQPLGFLEVILTYQT